MTDKNEEMQQKTLMLALEKIQTPLVALAVLKLADEFYTKEERTRLYAEYAELHAADLAAFEVLHQARDKEKIDQAELASALEAKQATGRAVKNFENEHTLIQRLLDAHATLSKGSYN